MVEKIRGYLDEYDTILDIGSGTCTISEILSEKGFQTTALDVVNLSFVKNIKPIIYDGNIIPFNDKTFNTSLILTVLHHTKNPENIISEAKRVSEKIIITEDIYVNRFHKIATLFLDSLLNLEFIGHPHSNKNDEEWKATFSQQGLKLIDSNYTYSFLVFKHATYFLEIK